MCARFFFFSVQTSKPLHLYVRVRLNPTKLQWPHTNSETYIFYLNFIRIKRNAQNDCHSTYTHAAVHWNTPDVRAAVVCKQRCRLPGALLFALTFCSKIFEIITCFLPGNCNNLVVLKFRLWKKRMFRHTKFACKCYSIIYIFIKTCLI